MSNFSRKLTVAEEAFVIRAVALRKQLTNVALAKRFNVHTSTITTIAYDQRLAKKLKGVFRALNAEQRA